MKSIARIVAIGAAAALTLGGCSTAEPGEGAEPGTGAEYGGGGKSIVFVQGVAGDEFYITMECGIKAKAEELGYTVETQGAQKFDPTLQKPIVDAVIASKPDALLVAPTDVTAMQAPLEQAAKAGIEVVLVDTTVDDPSFAVSEISSDNVGGGKAAFDAIKEQKPDGGKLLIISTDPGVSTVDARVKGFEDAVNEDSAYTSLGVQYSHNDPATAAQLVSSAFQKDPDIIGIFATNLFSAEGSSTGVRQAGKTDVTIVGFDAGPNQIKALEEGTVQALVAQQPGVIGETGVEAADAALTGGTPEKKVETGFTIITKDNLEGEGGDAAYKSSC